MPLYEIDGPDGKTYEIEGPPGATREQIIERVQAGLAAKPEAAPAKPNPIVDSIRSLPGGLAQGVAALAGLPGDVNDLMDSGANWIMSKVSGKPVDVSTRQLPTSGEINGKVSQIGAISGNGPGYYKPQTREGKQTESVARFAPAALSPGSALARFGRAAAPGVLSEDARQAAEGTPWEPLAAAGGALVGGLGVGAAQGVMARRGAPVPTADGLRSEAKGLYSAARNSGVEIRPLSYSNLVDNIRLEVAQAGTHPKLHPKVSGVLDVLDESRGQSLSLDGLERLRRVARGAASSIDADEQRVAHVILDHIDDYMDNLSPGDLISGDPNAGKLLGEARGVWQKLKKSDVIETAMERAKSSAATQNGNYAAGLRAEFQALSKNKKKMRGFSPEERRAILTVARVGPVTAPMAALGAMRPRGIPGALEGLGASSHILAGDYTAALPYVALGTGGYVAQKGLNAVTASRAKMASELMRAGPGHVLQNPKNSAANPLLIDALLGYQGAHR